MASEQDVTSDSIDSSVVAVPKELIGYVKTSIVDYINKATPDEFSASVHYAEGQAPKLDVLIGGNLFLVLHNYFVRSFRSKNTQRGKVGHNAVQFQVMDPHH